MDSSRILPVVIVLAAYITHLWMKSHNPLCLDHFLAVLLIAPLVLVCISVLTTTGHLDFHCFINSAPAAFVVFYSALVVFVAAYRLSPYHPLAKYPGPKIMKITKLWGTWIAYKGKTHEYLKKLHDQYGPTIRIGPNELSTIEKEFISQILGNQGMPKGTLWDGRRFSKSENEYDSLVSLRDSVLHAKLRKPWNQAFSAGPLEDYENLLLGRVTQLSRHLEGLAKAGGRVDITNWIDCFSFDYMGDLAFGGAFRLMEKGRAEEVRTMQDGVYLISITQHLPWIARFLHSTPIINSSMQRFIQFGVEQGVKRANATINHKDLFYHISESSESTESDLSIIISNVLLAIVAGADTTATVLSVAIYFLLKTPGAYKRVQNEVDEAFDEQALPNMLSSKVSRPHSDILGRLPYLNAVINESLRLFPPVATGLQRAPDKNTVGKLLKGITVADIYLPQGNAISVPPYVIHRDPRYFSPDPERFVPERWLSPSAGGTAGGYILARDAFIPFSYGPQNCVGRPLALMELRYVLSSLVRNFDMEFDTSSFDPDLWEEQFKDRFLLSKGKMDLLVQVREKTKKN
ncbi:cytochrome P450 [Pholiota conissans]|uniref:Cytochrome P450 n=1 Tax=Pholiota conissans TaxID=109636 RepID=A0A9P5YVL0_9AGAR|nr:cytochrome P450 [Pholiota conissans]